MLLHKEKSVLLSFEILEGPEAKASPPFSVSLFSIHHSTPTPLPTLRFKFTKGEVECSFLYG